MGTAAERADGLSMLEIAGAAMRYRRLIVGVGVGLAVVIAAWVLMRPRTYTSVASFTPQASRSQLGGLGGLAAQFGVMMPSAENNQSPQFYADLLESRTILEPLTALVVQFQAPDGVQRGTYADFARIKGTDTLLRREAAVNSLRAATSVNVAPRTGIVRLEIKTRYAQLSAILADSALHFLNRFNVETRRSQAATQRSFLELRLATVSQELREAEEAVADFSRRNRGDFRSSPELATQQERLTRAASLRAQVQGTLEQALEQAKLDEIRDTPLITVIETPRAPARPDARGLVFTSLVGFLAGTFLGLVLALVLYALDVARKRQPDNFASFNAEMAAAKSELRRVAWPFGKSSAAAKSSARD
jgi:uncharacterized protein involved in exopolysaccharide biosynthesis